MMFYLGNRKQAETQEIHSPLSTSKEEDAGHVASTVSQEASQVVVSFLFHLAPSLRVVTATWSMGLHISTRLILMPTF